MSRNRFRHTSVLAAVLLLLGLLAPGAAARAPRCGIAWGSLPKAAGTMQPTPLRAVRAGQHACFDRLVLELSGAPAAGYRVRYVTAVHDIGRGAALPLRGGAALQVDVLAPASDDRGTATYVPRRRDEVVDVRGHRTFRQVAWGGSFEGQSVLGVGVRARLPFRAFTLRGPGSRHRLVLDVAHGW